MELGVWKLTLSRDGVENEGGVSRRSAWLLRRARRSESWLTASDSFQLKLTKWDENSQVEDTRQLSRFYPINEGSFGFARVHEQDFFSNSLDGIAERQPRNAHITLYPSNRRSRIATTFQVVAILIG